MRSERTRGNDAARRAAVRHGAAVLAMGFALALGGSARAAVVDFESTPSGADAATEATPGISIDGGLVLDEGLIAILLGYPAAGTWNTTPGGSKGVLNSLSGIITLEFAVPVSLLEIDVLTLPDAAGDPGSLLLIGTDGALDVSAALDPGATPPGDSGLPEGRLTIAGTAITRAVLCPQALANPGTCLDPAEPTTFWLDQIRFEPIPEPATALLLGLTLGALAAHRRTV